MLGRYSHRQLDSHGGRKQGRMERALDYLYGREYAGRGVRGKDGSSEVGPGSLDPSQLSVPQWLSEIQELFPKETFETVEKHALERYGLDELVTNKETLERIEPSHDLLKMMLTFKGRMKGEVLETARKVIREVVEDLKRRLAEQVRQSFAGRINRFSRSPLKVSQNFDWKGTLRANLKNYQADRKQVVIDQLHFFSRTRRRIPWRIILCVDQSGSMVDSVIHSAVLAGILAGLPSVNVKLVAFDTSVVDLSEHIDDPVEMLMSVQLGGGTDIGQAVHYCEKLVEVPDRTIFVLISDFCEGASPNKLLSAVKRMHESRVKLVGLAALDAEAAPYYDTHLAGRLAALGMEISAATPKKFAEWLAKIIS